MLQYHYLNPETCEDLGLTFHFDINPLVELRFVHNGKEMLYKLPEYADEHDFMSDGPGTALDTIETHNWLYRILFDEVSHAYRAVQKDDPMIQDEWKMLNLRPFRTSVYCGQSNIPAENFQETMDQFGIKPSQYRMYIPIIWNETLQQPNTLRHGDICRVRFVHTDDLLWYQTHLINFKSNYSI